MDPYIDHCKHLRRERPAPAHNDVTESTPIHPKGETIRDRSSRLSTILPHPASARDASANASQTMGPPAVIPRDRRQTFAAPREDRYLVMAEQKYECHTPGKPRFQPGDLNDKFDGIARRETFVNVAPGEESWTPQRLTEDRVVRRTWEMREGISLLGRMAGALADTGLEEEIDLDRLENDSSFQLDSFALSPPRSGPKAAGTAVSVSASGAAGTKSVNTDEDEPLNLIVKKKNIMGSIYQPEVSDIR